MLHKEVSMSNTPTELKQTENISNNFELLPGKPLDLQINLPIKARIKVPLIGYEVGNNIILKYPNISQLGTHRDLFVEGNVVIVRYLLEGEQGECFAFKTSIKSVVKFPEKYLVLNYPTSIETRQLRLHQRIATHLPASIVIRGDEERQNSESMDGIIEDISPRGCGFAFKTNNQNLKVNQTAVFINIKNLMNGELNIPAKVCNSRNENGKVCVGIKFTGDREPINRLLEYLFIDVEKISA